MEIDKTALLEYLEGFISENRKQRFLDVLKNRTKHFTIAMEDVFQMHNTSAVMRSCEVFGIQEINIVEQRFGKNIDKEIAMGAQKWVDIQKQQFRDLGVLMQWDKSCTTMDPIYEAQTLRAFGIMVGKGYIARKQKTVPWCMHCQTVLANAEIEYEERRSQRKERGKPQAGGETRDERFQPLPPALDQAACLELVEHRDHGGTVPGIVCNEFSHHQE